MRTATGRALGMATLLITMWAPPIDAWAQARLPAQMYYAQLAATAERTIDAAGLNVIPASTVLHDAELAQLSLWLEGNARAADRAGALTRALKQRGRIHGGAEVVGLSGGQVLTTDRRMSK